MRKISLVLALTLVANLFAPLNAGAAEIAPEDGEVVFSNTADGAVMKIKILSNNLPANAADIKKICLPADEWYEYERCLSEGFEAGYANDTSKRFVAFDNIFIFNYDGDFGVLGEGALRVDTPSDSLYFDYQVTNYLYPFSLQETVVFVPGNIATINGYNLDASSSLYFLGKKIEATNITARSAGSISFKVPTSVTSGTAMVQLQSPFSNVTQVYVAPPYFDDPGQSQQWYLAGPSIYEAYDILTQSNDVVVAVIDDGVYLNHEDLKDNIWKNNGEISGNAIDDDKNGYVDDVFGWNFMDNSQNLEVQGAHGTAVAGIILAKQNNGKGIVGIAQMAKVMPVIVCDFQICNMDAMADAIKYAVDNGADVINISLLSIGVVSYTTKFDEAVKYAYNRNVPIVSAAGNGDFEGGTGFDLGQFPQSPVCNESQTDGVIGVGAVDFFGLLTTWSNFGECVDAYAPGDVIYSTSVSAITGNNYDYWVGTSFAAPIVTGLVAIVKSAYPNISNRALHNYLVFSHVDGALDAKKLFENITAGYSAADEFTGATFVESVTVAPFSDVDISHKNVTAIDYLKTTGVINGYPDGTFKPDNTVNRAELLKILVEGKDISPDPNVFKFCFPDVKEDWYAKYVCYAKTEGWVSGYPDGTFGPAKTVNKVEALKMLLNSQAVEIPGFVSTEPFKDVLLADWFIGYVFKAKSLNILEETGEYLYPAEEMKRSSISENLYRLLTL